MKSPNMGLFAIAAATAFVGALWAGVPLAGIVPLLIVLACPLMMIFMMRGMHGGSDDGRSHSEHQRRDEHNNH